MERPIDKIIREAAARGEFDNLPGKGKPLNYDNESSTPDELRLGYSVLKNAGYIPPEAQLLKDIDALREELERTTDEPRRQELLRQIREKRLRVDMFLEGLRRK